MGNCIFCGGDNSKEHIVAAWMLRDCDLYNTRFRMGFGQEDAEGKMATVTAPQPPGSFCTMDVCGSCNNRWMSQLENRMKGLLQPFIQQSWPMNDTELFRSLF